MQSNVINFAERVQARSEAVPTYTGLGHTTEIEIMMNDVRQSRDQLLVSSMEAENYALGNIDGMSEETFRLLILAAGKMLEANRLLTQCGIALETAARNEQRGGDNLYEVDLPDFPDWPA